MTSTEVCSHVRGALNLDFENPAGPPWNGDAPFHPRGLPDRAGTTIAESMLASGRPADSLGTGLRGRGDIPGRPRGLRASGGAGRNPVLKPRRPEVNAVSPERNRKRKPDEGLRDLDPSDPAWKTVELAQRGRMILDVSAADLGAAEAAFGPFHPTSWHFRNAWNEARTSWDRLRAEFGTATLDAALAQPPLTVMALGPHAEQWTPDRSGRWPLPDVDGQTSRPILLIPIGGKTYRVQRVAGTPLAPLLWRLTRLHPPLEDGPYYLCRLHDGTTQCDCAGWTYGLAEADPPGLCKHLRALAALGWL
jgi:hypothetical protein